MSDDPHLEALTRSLADMHAKAEEAVRRAYDLGFRAGGLATRESILRAAGAPMSIGNGRVQIDGGQAEIDALAREQSSRPETGPERERRAPRGMVQEAIRDVLTASPGLSVTEVAERVVAAHPVISHKSVGNQLRRFEGTHYQREGKYKWFLIQEPQTESAKTRDVFADILGFKREGGEAQ